MLKYPKMQMKVTVFATYFVNVFKSLIFHLSTYERELFKSKRFQNTSLFNQFWKYPFSSAFSGVFEYEVRKNRMKRLFL